MTNERTLFGFADNFNSSEEREAANRARLRAVHSAHGSLGTFYEMFPLEWTDEMARPAHEKRHRGESERER